MKAEQHGQSLAALLGFALVCASMSASRGLMDRWLPFWGVCCQIMRLSDELEAWLTLVTRLTLIGLLALGFGALMLRLWKTHRFVAGLNSASVAEPPARLARLLASLGLSRRVLVLRIKAPLAFCFGWLRPRICLSTGLADLLTEQELTAVLFHEDHHRRCRDPLRTLLAEVLSATLFFLPVTAELRDLFLASVEIDADRYALRLAGRPALAGALHKMLIHPLAPRFALAGIAGLNPTQARLAQLLDDHPPAPHLSPRSLITTSAILMLVCLLAP